MRVENEQVTLVSILPATEVISVARLVATDTPADVASENKDVACEARDPAAGLN